MTQTPIAEDAALPVSAEVFARFQAGEETALLSIAEQLHPRLYGYLRHFCRDGGLAEEVAQEAFLEAFRQRARILGPHQLRAWLYTVARRTALREMARSRHRLEIALDPAALEGVAEAVPPKQANAIHARQAAGYLESALAILNPGERDLITLRYFGGLSIKELAETLGMPMGSVGVKLTRALAKARIELERQGVGPEELL